MLNSLAAAILMLTLLPIGPDLFRRSSEGAQAEPPPVLRGTWTASVGAKKVFRGNWSAAVLAGTPNAAHGSWVLVNEANQIVLEGTWAAEKSPRGWRGSWSARVVPSRPSPRGSSAGRLRSGTWQAEMKDSNAKSLAELLQRTLTDQITGSWRSGALQGNWWLSGTGGSAR